MAGDSLEGVGTTRSVALVAAGRAKDIEGTWCPADLYAGKLFRLAYQHACENYEEVFILSPKNELVETSELHPTYRRFIFELSETDRMLWGRRVVNALIGQFPHDTLDITFYAGSMFVEAIDRAIREENLFWTTQDPLCGLDLWDAIAWFKEQLGGDL